MEANGKPTRTRKGWTKPTLDKLGVTTTDDGRFVIPLQREDGQPCGTLFYADDGRKPKAVAAKDTTRELFPRPEDVPGEEVWIVEGEPDAISAHEAELPGVGLPGAGKRDPAWPERIARGRTLVNLIPDCDDSGRSRMRDLGEEITRLGVEARIIELDRPEKGYDFGDLLLEQGAAAAKATVEGIASYSPAVWAPPPEPEPGPGPERKRKGKNDFAPIRAEVVTTRLSDVRMEPVVWAWKPYMPLGKLTILAGAPGQGKSQLTAMLAAHFTRGDFHGESDLQGPSSVLILSAEDDVQDTVAPRLMAAGADMARVHVMNLRTEYPNGISANGTIKLPENLPAIANALSTGDFRYVVLDPVSSFFGRDYSTHSNQDVREVLEPLAALAAEHRAAINPLMHLNKGEAKTWSEKIAESHGFQAVARTVLVLAPDPDAEEDDADVSRILAVSKINLARGATHALRLKVEGATVRDEVSGVEIETSRIVVTGRVEMPADDLLVSDPGERSAREEAIEFLERELATGWVPAVRIKADAKRHGISERTLERVRKLVAKRAKATGVAHGPWLWALKTATDPIPDVGDLGDLDDLVRSTSPRPPRNGTGHVATLNGRGDRAVRARNEATARMLGERDDDDWPIPR